MVIEFGFNELKEYTGSIKKKIEKTIIGQGEKST